jgi:hypothetical protein
MTKVDRGRKEAFDKISTAVNDLIDYHWNYRKATSS